MLILFAELVNPRILDLQLTDNFVFLKKINLQFLYSIQVVFDKWQILFILKFIDLYLKFWVVCFELFYQRNQDILFSLQIIVLYFQLVSSFLFLFQVKINHFILPLKHTYLQLKFFYFSLVLFLVICYKYFIIYPLSFEQIFKATIFCLQLWNFLLKLIYKCSMRISVNYWFVLNVHCFASVLNCIETFFIVWFTRTYTCYHISFRVSTQTVL